MNEPQAIYDSPWKQALEQYFEPFLIFFFPTAHAVIDWKRFPVAKLLDYGTQWQVLEESLNPFAMVVMAHLQTKATHNKPQERKQWKWSLVRRLFERGYSREDVVQLFRLIDWMMVLPEDLQREFKEQLSCYQKENQMPLLSRIELDAKQEGILLTLREGVITILEVRFGEVAPELIEVINAIKDVPVLKQLHRQAIAIPSIEEFQQLLEQHLAQES